MIHHFAYAFNLDELRWSDPYNEVRRQLLRARPHASHFTCLFSNEDVHIEGCLLSLTRLPSHNDCKPRQRGATIDTPK